jgi:1-pyrroline-5-carboxylate dehydrogenase
MAWLVFEVSKNWAEADADISETIDFCEFYARLALRLPKPKPELQLPGEHDSLRYIPLGVGAVIPPWNFPCAIMAGMTCASIVAGNTVILKPSSDSPTIAAKFVELLEEAACPRAWSTSAPAPAPASATPSSRIPKRATSPSPDRAKSASTSTKRAATQAPGQSGSSAPSSKWAAKTPSSSTADADFDSAVEGVAQAAFGFQGQKCSACSRAIVDERIYDQFLEQLKARVEKITVGDPCRKRRHGRGHQRRLDEVHSRIHRALARKMDASSPAAARHQRRRRLLHSAHRHRRHSPKSKLEQEEIFGPVLAVIKSHGFEHALEIANDTEFGLTGAVYTKSPDKIERAKRDFHVGNLYINRKCTGAMVGAHPFGGFNMSGTDSKAGGPTTCTYSPKPSRSPKKFDCHPEAGAFCPPKDPGEPREGSRFLRSINRASGSLPYYVSSLCFLTTNRRRPRIPLHKLPLVPIGINRRHLARAI